MSSFKAQPFLPPAPAPGTSHQSPWGQHSPPHMTPPFPLGGTVVLPAFPRTPLVAGDARHGPVGTAGCNVIVQVRSEQGPTEPPQTQTIVLTQAPVYWSSPGALCGGATGPAPLFLATSAVETSMPTAAVGGTWAGRGGSTPGLRPQPAPPAGQWSPVVTHVTAGPQCHAAPGEASPAGGPDNAPLEDHKLVGKKDLNALIHVGSGASGAVRSTGNLSQPRWGHTRTPRTANHLKNSYFRSRSWRQPLSIHNGSRHTTHAHTDRGVNTANCSDA
ncbi:NUT family member 2G-like [Suricata suricatta]|uniref:NUT family member 2G-like n=1 Tax=Suricata suricatta TaxID=37032 RepID=UPI0011557D9A|nr:NUT family member 2G-like [Suricata suricatta]